MVRQSLHLMHDWRVVFSDNSGIRLTAVPLVAALEG